MRRLEQLLREPMRAQMLPEFILRRAAELGAQRTEAIAEGAAHPPEHIRRAVVRALGLDALPTEPQVAWGSTSTHDGVTVRKLVFELIPGMPVPAHLYLPAGPGPHPALVHPPGHWMEDGKLAAPLQQLNVMLARNGIAVLSYDTLGQGERRVGWHQHGQPAPVLTGFTSLGVMVAETRAALTILQSLDEVDAARLGAVGASGGGFSSIFAAVVDERIQVAAISSIVNTHFSQIRDAAFGTGWDSWVDLCNQVPGLCTIGSMGEILAAIAPRHVLMANALDDPPFPIAGARAVAREVQAVLAARAESASFTYAEVPGGHGFGSTPMRDAVAGWLVAELLGRDADLEPPAPAFAPSWPVPHHLASAERPQTRTPQPSEGTCLPHPVDSNTPLVEFAKTRAVRLRSRPEPTVDDIVGMLGPFPERGPGAARVSRHLDVEGGFAQRLTIESEPGITLDAVLLLPENWSDRFAPVVVALDEGGGGAAALGPVGTLAREAGWACLCPDLRGTGESEASEFELATAAWMLDRDLLDQRVWDLTRCIDFLSERYSSAQQIDKGRIVLTGRGAFGLVALLTAVVDPRVHAVVVDLPYTLEDALVPSPHGVSAMLYRPGLLEVADIPDLVRLIAPRTAELVHDEAAIADALRRILT